MTLTRRQRDVLNYITASIAAGAPPTVREIGDEFGISSPNGVSCHLIALERKGYIVRVPGSARNIRLAIGDVCPCCGRLL